MVCSPRRCEIAVVVRWGVVRAASERRALLVGSDSYFGPGSVGCAEFDAGTDRFPSAVPETSQSRRVTRQRLQPAQARQIDFGLPPPGTRPFPRPGLPAAMSSTGAVPSGRHVSGGYTNRVDRNHDLAGGGPASPGRVESAPFHRRTSGRVLPDSVELDEMTSRTTQHPSKGTDMCVLIAGSRRSV
jgi:hypothetical protein